MQGMIAPSILGSGNRDSGCLPEEKSLILSWTLRILVAHAGAAEQAGNVPEVPGPKRHNINDATSQFVLRVCCRTLPRRQRKPAVWPPCCLQHPGE